MPRPLALLLALALVGVAGCSGLNEGGGSGVAPRGTGGGAAGAPEISARSTSKSASVQLGFPVTATRDTTRVPGGDAVADVAGVVSAIFPATSSDTRPHAVAIVDQSDWQNAVAASVLMAQPLGIPILLSDAGKLPPASGEVLARMKPTGSPLAQNAEIIRIGSAAARPSGYRTAVIPGSDPYTVASGLDRFFSVARGRPAPDVVVTSGEQAGFAMPAAAWAARSGNSVLFVKRDAVPAPTQAALRRHAHPRIWVLGPPSVIGPGALKQLAKFGRVQRISGLTPVANAIAFARFHSGSFGWGITTPGQNFTVASISRPADAAGAAVLGTAGVFAPLLLTDRSRSLPSALEGYFLDVQPGYQQNPNSGVFNHVWILGDSSTMSVAAQGRLDTITELVPVQTKQP